MGAGDSGGKVVLVFVAPSPEGERWVTFFHATPPHVTLTLEMENPSVPVIHVLLCIRASVCDEFLRAGRKQLEFRERLVLTAFVLVLISISFSRNIHASVS